MRQLAWSGVAIPPAVITQRYQRLSGDTWTVAGGAEGSPEEPHARALDTRACAALHVEGKVRLYLDWFLREFLEEPARGLPRLYSGHAQMFNATATNAGPRGARQRAAATGQVNTAPTAIGEPLESEGSRLPAQRALARYHAQPPHLRCLTRASLLTPQVRSLLAHPCALTPCAAPPPQNNMCDACGARHLDMSMQCQQCLSFCLCQACYALSIN